MSDRREAVAAALVAALGKYGSIHDAGYGFTTLTLYHDDMPHIARRLLDAMDAEPTEAEIDAARQAYWNERRALSNTGLDTWTGDDSAWAAALIAARKAGRE